MARPPKPIDWKLVEQKIQAGCSGTEIAPEFYINDATFYRRFEEEYGKTFQEYRSEFRSVGIANLKHRQYLKAMQGNPQMLIWLGKQWLGQTEKNIDKDETEGLINAILEKNASNRNGSINQSGMENSKSLCNQGSERQQNSICSKLGARTGSLRPPPPEVDTESSPAWYDNCNMH